MWVTVSILAALFWAAFLAATVLPLSSEAALSAALAAGVPAAWCLPVATLGNVLGSGTTFWLGRCGKMEWLRICCRVSAEEIEAARKRIGRYGGVAAFLCFLPLLGDGFAIALGFMRYPAGRFFGLMALGKLLRYLVWIILHQAVAA